MSDGPFTTLDEAFAWVDSVWADWKIDRFSSRMGEVEIRVGQPQVTAGFGVTPLEAFNMAKQQWDRGSLVGRRRKL